MGIVKEGKEAFEPYARLISILGDQLISDKWVGVIELVKNCYDADAERVFVRFLNFDNPSKDNPRTIEIEDDGKGMDIATVLDVWMKPATPNKLNLKKQGEKRFTDKGRVMQGDKGVGRFAIYKLGNHVEMFTKAAGKDEAKVLLDFVKYADDEFEESNHKDKLLSEIKNKWSVSDSPLEIKNAKGQGTKIIIKDLRDEWKEKDLNKLTKAFYRMTPPKLPRQYNSVDEFDVKVFWGSEEKKIKTKRFEEFLDTAPFFFEGMVDGSGTISFSYKSNRKEEAGSFNFFDDNQKIAKHNIWGLKFFRENFLEPINEEKKLVKENLKVGHRPSFGPFMFFFYAFDFANPAEGLSADEKAFLKEHSVFLFRDNVRVFPYGERGVDWLLLSKYRAEDRAGNYFSYNDLLGFVFVTQEENPNLRDAADREGLMNIRGSYDDFVAVMQGVLKVMKDYVDIDKAKHKVEKQKVQAALMEQFRSAFEKLQTKVLQSDDVDLLDKSNKLFDATTNLVERVREELKITQELAGTGMAVEKATHDTMSLIRRLSENTNDLVKRFKKNEVSDKEVEDFLRSLEEDLEFLYQELQVLQPLFRVARKVTKDVSVEYVANRVERYFRKDLQGEIDLKIEVPNDITVKTNTGLILQVLLNLMDNAIYWVSEYPQNGKRILIKIDGFSNELIFADSGLGVEDEIQDIIFTEFYSKKEEGRGLGLYIVKELLERIDASISLVTEDRAKLLPGANFRITFNSTV